MSTNLIGFKKLPKLIQERMLFEQELQTGKKDKSVFINDKCASMSSGGFLWSNSVGGYGFWSDILHHNKFHIFFERYVDNTWHQNKSAVIEKQSTIDTIKIYHSFVFKDRVITLCVTNNGLSIMVGYAVKNIDDKPDQDLAKKISLGRACNNKSNLLRDEKDCTVGKFFITKEMFIYIAKSIEKKIQNGNIIIKGIR